MISAFEDKKPVIAPSCWIHDSAQVIGEVRLADNVSIWPCAVLRGDWNSISVGENSNIQDGCVLHVDTDAPCAVGANCIVGHKAILHGTRVGNNCLIGMGAILLNRSVIEDNCLIAAGALVTEGKTIPAGSLVVGSPAKVLRQLTKEEIAKIRSNALEYVTFARRHQHKKAC